MSHQINERRLDHVTYHVPPGTLDRRDLEEFFELLRFEEIEADDIFEHGWKVRWFRPFSGGTAIHLVEGSHQPENGVLIQHEDRLALGHFCVHVGKRRLEQLKELKYCERNSGSGRIWLTYANLRVEVRP